MTIYRQATENAAGLQADPTKPRFLHQLDGQQCGISHQCKAVLVIDPEDREQVEDLRVAYHARRTTPDHSTATDDMQAALRSLLEPEPEEPTRLGAVAQSDDGSTWVRAHLYGSKPWVRSAFVNESRCWADLPRPITVLSEGWQESTDE